MKHLITLSLAVVLGCGLVCGAASAQIPDADLQKIVTYEFGQTREPLTVVADLVRASLTSPDQKKAVAAQLAALLGGDATLDCKQFACRQLVLAAGPENVPAIAALLEDEKTSDMARYALEPIAGIEASQALIDALAKTNGKVKVGIINSLGARKCPNAVAAVAPLMADSDAVIAEAAIAALGKIGTPEAATALAAATGAVAEPLRIALADSYLLCADKCVADGDLAGAKKIYEEMFADAQPLRIRVAAFQGLATALGADGVDFVAKALTDQEPALQGAATALVRTLPGENATKAFAKQLDKMSPEAEVRVIGALADRGDKAAAPAVLDAAKSKDEAIRMAGLAALANLGDGSCVMLLAKAAADAGGRDRETIAKSLYTMPGDDVDQAILRNLGKADAPVAVELIKSAVERNLTAAVPLLIEAAGNKDEAVQKAAFKALGVLAAPADLPALVAQLVAASDAARTDAEKAVTDAGNRIEDASQRGAAVLAALNAAKDAKIRCSLLKVLGSLGDPTTLDAVRAAVKDTNAEVQVAAIRALSEWPTVAPLDDLLAIVKGGQDDTQKVLALRGYVKLLALPSDRPVADTLAKYAELLGLAARPDDKKAVLAGLATVADPGALTLVDPFLTDADLQAEAIAACLKIDEAIGQGDAVKANIAKILEISKDENVQKAAKDLQGKIK